MAIDVEAGTAGLSTLAAPPGSLSIPLAPMVGCFGVAPPDGQTIATTTSGQYGGNMDYPGFTAGATVYLPVFVQGALFFIGDGHAAQGDGEIVGTGIETSFDVQFTVRILKGKTIAWPRGADLCAHRSRLLRHHRQGRGPSCRRPARWPLSGCGGLPGAGTLPIQGAAVSGAAMIRESAASSDCRRRARPPWRPGTRPAGTRR